MSHGVTDKPDTWMPLYVGDYLRKTMHLTTEEHGAYLLLIMACWVNGGAIPDDKTSLSRAVGLSGHRWFYFRKRLAPFFEISDGVWRNKRVTEELAKAVGLTEQRRLAGRASAKAKRQRALNKNANERTNARSTSVPTPVVDNFQRNARPSPLGEGVSSRTEPYPESNSEPRTPRARAHEADDGKKAVSKKNGFDPQGRFAPLASASPSPTQTRRKELLRQKLLRFADAKYAGAARSAAIAGLCGSDPNHDEQWWLDTLDQKMRRAKWDDNQETNL